MLNAWATLGSRGCILQAASKDVDLRDACENREDFEALSAHLARTVGGTASRTSRRAYFRKMAKNRAVPGQQQDLIRFRVP